MLNELNKIKLLSERMDQCMPQYPLRENQLLNEESIDDFFNFLERDPRKTTFAYAYYTYPVNMNKFIMDETGNKIPNPMYGKLFKNIKYQFNYGEVYRDAMLKIDPNYEFGKKKGEYNKVQGFKVIETGKSGLYLPIMPTYQDYNYSINEDGNWKNISFDEIAKYLPNKTQSEARPREYRQLILDRIARISAGGNVWKNPHFIYQYLGPGGEK